MNYDVMKAAFADELQKIAASAGVDVPIGGHRKNYALGGAGLGGMGGAIAGQFAKNPSVGLGIWGAGTAAGALVGHHLGKKKDIKLSKKLREMGADPAKFGIKEAGAHVRSGRRPLKVSTLLEKEKEVDSGQKLADMTKMALKSIDAKTLGVAAVGAYGLHSAQKIKRRYQLGRQMELQQQGGY